MTLSDIGSWASIIGFILSFILGVGICRITKNNKQEPLANSNQANS